MMNIEAIGNGALNFDYLYVVDALATDGHQATISESFETPGGSCANAIYGLAKLGIKTGFVGAVGDDYEGERVLLQMQKVKIDTSKIKSLSKVATSKIFVFIDRNGERVMYSLPGASNKFKGNTRDISWLSKSKYVLLSSIAGGAQLQFQKKIVTEIHKTTRIVYMPGALYLKYDFSKLKDIITKSFIIILNRREIQQLTNCDYHSGAQLLVEKGCCTVAVTLGAAGCFIYDGRISSLVSSPKLPKNRIVDSTGAGDAFAAGLIFGLLNDRSLSDAAVFGNIAARCCIQGLGARTSLPDKRLLNSETRKYTKQLKIKNID